VQKVDAGVAAHVTRYHGLHGQFRSTTVHVAVEEAASSMVVGQARPLETPCAGAFRIHGAGRRSISLQSAVTSVQHHFVRSKRLGHQLRRGGFAHVGCIHARNVNARCSVEHSSHLLHPVMSRVPRATNVLDRSLTHPLRPLTANTLVSGHETATACGGFSPQR